MKVRVASILRAATNIVAIELKSLDGGNLPAFSAGSHIDVRLASGLVRQYSLANAPHERHRYLIAVLLETASRGGSSAMHALREGDVIEIGEPANLFPLEPQAEHSILVAGGIGITPILSMAEALARSGASFKVVYCAREASRAAFSARFGEADMRDRTHLHFDDANAGPPLDLMALLGSPEAGKHVYVCGPAGLIAAVLEAANDAGWDPANVHREFFAAPSRENGEPDRAFSIRLGRSGRTIRVREDETALEALAREGVAIDSSCEQGVCGTCLTPVLDGIPDHRDSYLTDSEKATNQSFLPCCSRSLTPALVVDVQASSE
jgi:vanillate monooxygenase ferredoxin subunit